MNLPETRQDLPRTTTFDPSKWSELKILTREVASRWIIDQSNHYYVYVLCHPDGTPFYVGKGVGRRIFQHEAEAHNPSRKSHKLNVMRKLLRQGASIGYAFDGFFEREFECLARERELIAHFGRFDLGAGPLTNQIDGGEGASNPSAEARQRHAASLGGEADDHDRRVGNVFLASIAGEQESVPIKPWRVLRTRAHLLRPSPKKPVPSPSLRMCKAIVASSITNQIILEPGAIIPRRLLIDNIEFVIENGCGGDMIHAGLVQPIEPRADPLYERIRLTKLGHEAVVKLIGVERLVQFGVLEP